MLRDILHNWLEWMDAQCWAADIHPGWVHLANHAEHKETRAYYKEKILAAYRGKKMALKIIEIHPKYRELVEANNGYCPCAIFQTPDTKCMCKDFREKTEPGECFCGRFEKVADDA